MFAKPFTPADLFTSYFVPRPASRRQPSISTARRATPMRASPGRSTITPHSSSKAASAARSTTATRSHRRARDRQALGCSPLFREAGSVGVRLSENWSMMATVEHCPDGGACADNQRLDECRRTAWVYVLTATFSAISRGCPMVVLNRIYTRTGDKGHDGARVPANGGRNTICASTPSAQSTRPMPASASPGFTRRDLRRRRHAGAHSERSLRSRRGPCDVDSGKPLPYEPLRIVGCAGRSPREGDRRLNARTVGAALLRPAGRHARRGRPAPGADRLPARRAPRRGALDPRRRGGLAGRDEIPQPPFRFSLRRLPLRERQGRARRALGSRPEPLSRTAEAEPASQIRRPEKPHVPAPSRRGAAQHMKTPVVATRLLIAACILAYPLTFYGPIGDDWVVAGFGLIPAVFFGTEALPDGPALRARLGDARDEHLPARLAGCISSATCCFSGSSATMSRTPWGTGASSSSFSSAARRPASPMPSSTRNPTRPLIGASGAVSGVVAAYLILYPRVRIWALFLNGIPLRAAGLLGHRLLVRAPAGRRPSSGATRRWAGLPISAASSRARSSSSLMRRRYDPVLARGAGAAARGARHEDDLRRASR